MNIACEKRKSSFYDISQRSGEGLETLLSDSTSTLDRAIVSAPASCFVAQLCAILVKKCRWHDDDKDDDDTDHDDGDDDDDDDDEEEEEEEEEKRGGGGGIGGGLWWW